MIIDCKSIAQDIKNKIKNIIAEADYTPVLHIYQVGDNPATIFHPTLIFAASCVTVKRLESKRSLSSYQKRLPKMG